VKSTTRRPRGCAARRPRNSRRSARRLSPEARATAARAAFDRLVRESLGLPTVGYEG
jgi:hypothetical protein